MESKTKNSTILDCAETLNVENTCDVLKARGWLLQLHQTGLGRVS